jgi:SAM-dependent methyltransferase
MIFEGMLSCIPGRAETGMRGKVMEEAALPARYYYSVWLRHLVMAFRNGFANHPESIAELGPGDSLGTGLAAMLCGVKKYFAFDAVQYASIEHNLNILEQLIELFKKREAIPDDKEFPLLEPYLDDYGFPSALLTEERLQKTLSDESIHAIRSAVINMNKETGEEISICYIAPWEDHSIIRINSVDMVLSQAVLEHIDELEEAYAIMHLWLKSNGIISHAIDFRSHGLADSWNGHWGYSRCTWRLIRGRRKYLINRHPRSVHIDCIKNIGFKIIGESRIREHGGIARNQIAILFSTRSEDDLCTRSTFVQAVKFEKCASMATKKRLAKNKSHIGVTQLNL